MCNLFKNKYKFGFLITYHLKIKIIIKVKKINAYPYQKINVMIALENLPKRIKVYFLKNTPNSIKIKIRPNIL
jgi:hypothetical protein